LVAGHWIVAGVSSTGIVAKAKHAAYGEKWFKIRNPRYSQYEGRRELLERRAGASSTR
jgi:hypothetical protein